MFSAWTFFGHAFFGVRSYCSSAPLKECLAKCGTTKSAFTPGSERVWKVWKKYGICFFNFQTWKKYENLWKALETSKKGLELFAFYLRKILKTESVPPARALGSCCRAFDRKQFVGCTVFHICSYSSYKLRRAGPELLARRFKQKKRHVRNSSFVKKRSFASQAVDPDFRPAVFVNEESSPELVICSLL